MRVALVAAATTHHDDTDRTRRVRRLAELLREDGHDVVVCCARWWGGEVSRFETDGLAYRAVADEPRGDAFAARLPVVLPAVAPDVVCVVHDRPTHVLGARLGAAFARAPLVVDWYDVRDPDGAEGLVPRLRAVARDRAEFLASRVPERIVAPSRLVRRRVYELSARDGGVEVVPNAIDFDRITATDPVEAADVVLSGRLDADANVESLLLALAELREFGWRALVVGDGPMRERYERQARDLRIDDRVSFAGDLSLDERIARFRGAHVCVHTAARTPFPTDLLWALACGCAGIVEYRADSAAHELVERWDRGFLATGDEELSAYLREAADLERKDVEERFADYDEERVLEEYERVFADARDSFGPI
ncbi:MAG: glycosyltransferase family 4 protein [Halobacteriaceae archaeon]